MATTNPDPIANTIALLAVLVTPTATGTGAPNTTPLYGTIQSFLGVIFAKTTSAEMNAVSVQINTALTDVAAVLTKVATAMQTAGSLTDVSGAMTALQNSLSLAQSLAPAGTAVVLNSASGLFQQLQAQLTAIASTPGATIAQAATELAQLSQLLTALAGLFPTS